MKRILFISYLTLLVSISCSSNGPSPEDLRPPKGGSDEDVVCSDYVTIGLNRKKDASVSEKLLGFNTVYANNPDDIWSDGKLASAIKAVRPGFLRYPGGTVTTFYHWHSLTGNGWADSWDPSYNHKTDKNPSEFMNLDEYLSLIRKTGAEPMIGVNCNSAFVYDRLEDGIEEALSLMRYVKEKGFDVKYWFIGNEPFAKDGNGGTWTPAEYAEMVKAFAPKMKEFDPSIKIIVNDHANMVKNSWEYDKILSIAGQWIDVIDMHWYWNHGSATWQKWLNKTPCGISGGNSYMDEVGAVRAMAAKNGYPDIEVATLEWNCGPSTDAEEPFKTAGQMTLVQGEMIMQFMLGGLDMACFWPLFWNGDYSQRGFIDKNTRKLLPISQVMKNFGEYQGNTLVETSLNKSVNHLMVLAVADDDSDQIRIAVLNKNNYSIGVKLGGALAGNTRQVSVVSFHMNKDLSDIIMSDKETKDIDKIISLPYSLTFITL